MADLSLDPRTGLFTRYATPTTRWDAICFRSLWALVFTVPWGDMVLLPYQVQFSRLITVLTVAAWLLSVCKKNLFRPPLFVHAVMFAFVAWAGMSVLWTANPEHSARRLLSYTQLFMDTWLVYQFASTQLQHQRLLQAFVLGAYAAIGGLGYNALSGKVQGDGRYTAPGFDPNDLAATLALGIPLAWYLALTSRKRLWLNRLYLPCSITGVLLTASRSGFVVLALAMVFPLLTWPKVSARNKISLLALVLASAFGVFQFGESISFQRLSTITEQFSKGDLNGRVDIWQSGYAVFEKYSLMGVGAGAFSSSMEGNGIPVAAHNTFLEILVEHGPVGLLGFLTVVFCLFRKAWFSPMLESRMWTVLLVAWLAAVSVLSWGNREITWLLWGLCTAQHWTRAARNGGGRYHARAA